MVLSWDHTPALYEGYSDDLRLDEDLELYLLLLFFSSSESVDQLTALVRV